MEKNWLEKNVKNIKISLEIVQKLESQINSLKILSILFVLAKQEKNNLIQTTKVMEASQLSKSSFYQSIKDLSKLKFVVLKNGYLSLTVKLYKSNKQFLRFHYKSTLPLIGKLSAKKLISLFSLNFLMKIQKVKKIKSVESNKRSCWKNCRAYCRGECLQTQVIKTSRATFTFSFFKNWNLKHFHLARFLKDKIFNSVLEKVLKIKIYWKRSWKKHTFKTIHIAVKQTIKLYD